MAYIFPKLLADLFTWKNMRKQHHRSSKQSCYFLFYQWHIHCSFNHLHKIICCSGQILISFKCHYVQENFTKYLGFYSADAEIASWPNALNRYVQVFMKKRLLVLYLVLQESTLVGEGSLESVFVLCVKKEQEQASLQGRTNQEQPQHRLCSYQSTAPSQLNRLDRISLMVTDTINSGTQEEVVNEVQGPSKQSSEEHQEMGPEAGLWTRPEHRSRSHLGGRAEGRWTDSIAQARSERFGSESTWSSWVMGRG